LGICDLNPGEAKQILKDSPNLDLLILDGILNKVEEEEIRKNSNSDIHENYTASDSLLLHE